MVRTWMMGTGLLLLAVLVWSLHGTAAQSDAGEGALVNDTSYVSSEFGYAVVWTAPWVQEAAQPVLGASDSLRLSAAGTHDEVYMEFHGIATDATTEEAIRAVLHRFADERNQRTPGMTISQEWAPGAPSPTPMFLSFPIESGNLMMEAIDFVPLVPGESAYLWVRGHGGSRSEMRDFGALAEQVIHGPEGSVAWRRATADPEADDLQTTVAALSTRVAELEDLTADHEQRITWVQEDLRLPRSSGGAIIWGAVLSGEETGSGKPASADGDVMTFSPTPEGGLGWLTIVEPVVSCNIYPNPAAIGADPGAYAWTGGPPEYLLYCR